MVKMFVNDVDYRKQLSETVSTSMVYKKDRKVAKFADDQRDFRMGSAEKQIKELEEKNKTIRRNRICFKNTAKWARE